MEHISVLDMFKVGVGPSSSHTLGPWKAALQFSEDIKSKREDIKSLEVHLYGSLAKTGKGHGTDIAVLLGLCGEDPVVLNTDHIEGIVSRIRHQKKLKLGGLLEIGFDPIEQIQFHYDMILPYHPNALAFTCVFQDGTQFSETFYSIGGGFIIKKGEGASSGLGPSTLPYPVETADELLKWCNKKGMTISGLVAENEKSWRTEKKTHHAIMNIWSVMKLCMYKGCHTEGVLPGGLHVLRRASRLNTRFLHGKTYTDYHSWTSAIRKGGTGFAYILDWVSCFALAVNEENASFGRVVTAPTNGAAGVIPAVIQYMITFKKRTSEGDIKRFLLCSSEIGSIFKKQATISAAMGGCQAEIGVSSAMAAAGLTECMGGTVEQSLMAAEISMEHHLGLTCDPVGGLVQVPCIERNTMGAIKAITASQLALNSDPGKARVSLDAVVKTMWETAQDMNSKYKETSDGGLAINIPISLSEC